MEKNTPHHNLEAVRSKVRAGFFVVTVSAYAGAQALGIDHDGVLRVVLSLTRKDFYKSMTTLNDARLWQDVYNPLTTVGVVYCKIMIRNDCVVVISFKEL